MEDSLLAELDAAEKTIQRPRSASGLRRPGWSAPAAAKAPQRTAGGRKEVNSEALRALANVRKLAVDRMPDTAEPTKKSGGTPESARKSSIQRGSSLKPPTVASRQPVARPKSASGIRRPIAAVSDDSTRAEDKPMSRREEIALRKQQASARDLKGQARPKSASGVRRPRVATKPSTVTEAAAPAEAPPPELRPGGSCQRPKSATSTRRPSRVPPVREQSGMASVQGRQSAPTTEQQIEDEPAVNPAQESAVGKEEVHANTDQCDQAADHAVGEPEQQAATEEGAVPDSQAALQPTTVNTSVEVSMPESTAHSDVDSTPDIEPHAAQVPPVAVLEPEDSKPSEHVEEEQPEASVPEESSLADSTEQLPSTEKQPVVEPQPAAADGVFGSLISKDLDPRKAELLRQAQQRVLLKRQKGAEGATSSAHNATSKNETAAGEDAKPSWQDKLESALARRRSQNAGKSEGGDNEPEGDDVSALKGSLSESIDSKLKALRETRQQSLEGEGA